MDQTSSVVAEPKPQPEAVRRSRRHPSPADSEPLSAASRDLEPSAHQGGIILAGLVTLIAVFFLWRYLGSYESTDDAQIDGHVNSVSARVSGHVVKLNVEDNQYVEKGTVLVEIDPADYEVAVAQARAEYADAQAQASAAGINVPITDVSTASQVSGAQAGVSGAKAGIAAARQQFEAAKSQVAEADANNTKAQNDLVRYKQLIDKQEISQQQYDQAVASAQAAAANSASGARQRRRFRGADRTGAEQTGSRPAPIFAPPTPRRRRCGSPAPAPFPRRPMPIAESRIGPGGTEPPVHQSDCAGQRSRQQPHRRGRAKRAARPGDDENHPAR